MEAPVQFSTVSGHWITVFPIPGTGYTIYFLAETAQLKI
jgi:hypothetical protein